MQYIVDRIEENIAVCEDENKKMVDIEIDKLPIGVKEGDIIKQLKGKYIIDKETRKERKKNIQKRMDNLWK